VGLVRDRRNDAAILSKLASGRVSLGADTLLSALGSIRRPAAAASVVRLACSGSIEKTPGLLRVLSDIALVATSKTVHSRTVPGVGSEVAEWLRTIDTQALVALREGGQRTHDRIARAVELAELSRQRENVLP
jgi:hypothetical protein